ncbi:uncharacterized protein LOC125422871 [Ziziphus jujuba]|uniref:Uncharacterized protein LOC125422871 n=2 Tax=Ziziphus jujuba TaxID=326968 RepID=A0ABM3ILR4_ZIZJJ|nr:uncharacterized protein LOC125422871 [Ziziphus jujuba]KAH7523761.1 hypothetical protein FEM48_Zijuj06G0046300 [Ziziphus jujuba var. spinosa]
MHRRSHSEVSSVPFSWEYRPGVSKHNSRNGPGHLDHKYEMDHFNFQLPPPPPYSSETSAEKDIDHNNNKQAKLSMRLLFQLLSFRLGNFLKLGCTVIKVEDDPFVAAYLNCTQSPFIADFPSCSNGKSNSGSSSTGVKKTMFTLSCKYSCTVGQNDVVKISQLPK